MADSVVAIAGRRRTRADETGRCAVLYPAIAERIAQRAGLARGTVIRRLGGLASAGFIERCQEGWRLRRAQPPRMNTGLVHPIHR
jgi:hypothetical protein